MTSWDETIIRIGVWIGMGTLFDVLSSRMAVLFSMNESYSNWLLLISS